MAGKTCTYSLFFVFIVETSFSDLPDHRTLNKLDVPVISQTLALCQEAVVRWVTTFTHSARKQEPSVSRYIPR